MKTEQWALVYEAPRAIDDDAYVFALDYAEKRYEEIVKVSEVLDKKLDDVARTSLTIATIVATVARVAGINSAYADSRWTATAIFCFVVSVCVAVLTRSPTQTTMPMNARTLLEAMDLPAGLPKHQIEAATAASYHYAAIATAFATRWKAVQLKRATSLFCAGLIFLILMWATTPLSP